MKTITLLIVILTLNVFSQSAHRVGKTLTISIRGDNVDFEQILLIVEPFKSLNIDTVDVVIIDKGCQLNYNQIEFNLTGQSQGKPAHICTELGKKKAGYNFINKTISDSTMTSNINVKAKGRDIIFSGTVLRDVHGYIDIERSEIERIIKEYAKEILKVY